VLGRGVEQRRLGHAEGRGGDSRGGCQRREGFLVGVQDRVFDSF